MFPEADCACLCRDGGSPVAFGTALWACVWAEVFWRCLFPSHCLFSALSKLCRLSSSNILRYKGLCIYVEATFKVGCNSIQFLRSNTHTPRTPDPGVLKTLSFAADAAMSASHWSCSFCFLTRASCSCSACLILASSSSSACVVENNEGLKG